MVTEHDSSMKFNYTFPKMGESILANGMRVIYLPDFSNPVLLATLQICKGKNSDPIFHEGCAELTVNLMQKGTKSLSSEEFAERLEYNGSMLFSDTKEEYITICIQMLLKASDEMIPLFWDMILNPAFDNKEFFRLKKEMLTGIKAAYSDPNVLADNHFHAALFGASHPAGRNYTLKSIKHITLENIKTFFNNFISPENAILVVAGSLEISEMKEKWEKMFLSWEKKGVSVLSEYEAGSSVSRVPGEENNIRIVDKPELSQTTLYIGHLSVNELHENKSTLALANYILGGGNFSSRLMTKVRSESGETYGINSYLVCAKAYGYFLISTTTRNSQLKNVITRIFDTYNDYICNGATELEIEKAKQFAKGNMAFELEGLNKIVEKIIWLRFYKRDNQYIENYNLLLSKIDANSVKEVLQNNFASKNFIIAAVGKRKEIINHIKDFGNIQYFKSRSDPIAK